MYHPLFLGGKKSIISKYDQDVREIYVHTHIGSSFWFSWLINNYFRHYTLSIVFLKAVSLSDKKIFSLLDTSKEKKCQDLRWSNLNYAFDFS